MNGPRGGTALVLSGGGAKAAAHLGAARALHEAGIVPSHYVGTSMGAVVAVALAAGLAPDDVLTRLEQLSRTGLRRHPLAPIAGMYLPGLLRQAPLRAALEALLPVRSFAELGTPVTVTAVDMDTGEEVAYGAGGVDGPLIDVLLASDALPVFLPDVQVGGRRMADGGLRAVVPLHRALSSEPDRVIAVHIGPGFDEAAPAAPSGPMPAMVRAHNDAMGILMAALAEAQLALWRATPGRPPLVYVRPPVERNATFRVDRMRQYAADGYAAMRAALSKT